jgi:enoyl-CoA hydratase/carnithine racemase
MTEVALPEGLRLEAEGAVATLVIDRPARRNALNLAMWQAVPRVVAAVQADAAVRVFVLRGAGDGPFSAGADIAEFATVRGPGEPAQRYSAAVHAAEQSLARLTKPSVALIQGWCVGGGCELALACDLRVADDTAQLGITPSKLGIVYNQTSTARLVEVVGPAWARYLLMTGELVDAAQALRIGLVHEVHPVAAAAWKAGRLADVLATRAPVSVAGAKQLIGRAAAGTAAEDDWAQRWYASSAASAEYREGVSAFAEKRTPDFSPFGWPALAPDGAPD